MVDLIYSIAYIMNGSGKSLLLFLVLGTDLVIKIAGKQTKFTMFEGLCKVCNTSTNCVNAYVAHMRTHRNQAHIRFGCCFQNCMYNFSTFAAFHVHVSRKHRNQRNEERSSHFHSVNVPLKCTVLYCRKECTNLHTFLKHLKMHIDQGKMVNCPYVSCSKKYNRKISFCAHLSRYHKNWSARHVRSDYKLSSDNETCSGTAEYQTVPSPESHMEYNEGLEEYEVESLAAKVKEQSPIKQSKVEFLNSFALFLLKLQGKHLVPESTVQVIIEELQSLHGLFRVS